MTRYDLTEEQWVLVEPLLPPQKPRTGRPARNHREVVNGILWIARTGAPWRDLPESYGPWQTVYSRLRRWSREGIWQRVFDALLAEAQRRQDLDWNLHHIDSTVIRAHQHAAGAQKRGTRTPPAESS
jgi:transposase